MNSEGVREVLEGEQVVQRVTGVPGPAAFGLRQIEERLGETNAADEWDDEIEIRAGDRPAGFLVG
jgi:hypothetical protein